LSKKESKKDTVPLNANNGGHPILLIKIIVLICGACLMGLEMAGVRLLQPYFGSTIYVWGSIIGLFLGALSFGYWLGGILADRYPRLPVLGYLILAAAASTLLIPWLAPTICRWLAGYGQQEPAVTDPRLRALLGSTLLYAVPSAFLGMVSPFAVRLAADDVKGLGSLAGSLYAISTLGSIIGTFLVSFVLVEFMGSRMIVWCIAILLIGVALLCFIKNRSKIGLVTTILLCCTSVPGYQAAEKDDVLKLNDEPDSKQTNLFHRESVYHHISIIETMYTGQPARLMLFNNQVESGVLLDSLETGAQLKNKTVLTACGYTRMLHLGILATKQAPKRVLVIGCGGGIAPQAFAKDYKDTIERIDVVDIDPMVIQLAEKYFQFPAGTSHPVIRGHVGDGRLFVNQSSEKWDYIILDAYTTGGRVPQHLITKEFFLAIRSHLTKDGVLVANLISALKGRYGRLYRSVFKTLEASFGKGQVYAFPRWHRGEQAENIILLAVPNQKRLTHFLFNDRFNRFNQKLLQQPDLKSVVNNVQTQPPYTEEDPLLTDDFCPTDSMVTE